jgi:Zn-dependent protease with chaperone function/tetratricopeptide (TPR) repeat protein
MRRLNPFVLPSETNLRFLLLIVAAGLLAVGIGNTVATGPLIAQGGIIEDHADVLQPGFTEDLSGAEQQALVATAIDKWRTAALPFTLAATGPLLLLSAVLLASYIRYRGHPARRRRAQPYQPLPPDRDPLLYDELERLAQQAGLPMPQIVVDKAGVTATGQVWGVPDQYVLRLGGGMRFLLRQRPGAFRAIVLHELAHIVNGDIGRTYFTQALWAVMIIVALLTTATAAAGLANLPAIVRYLQSDIRNVTSSALVGFLVLTPLLLPWVGLILALAAIRASVLRSREYEADWRAATWSGSTDLVDVLQRGRRSYTSWLRRPWALHPDPHARIATLQEPDRLMKSSLLVCFLVGILVAYVIYGLPLLLLDADYAYSVISDFARGMADVLRINGSSLALSANATAKLFDNLLLVILMAAVLLGGLGCLYLAVGPLALQVQRQSLREAAKGATGLMTYLSLALPAGACAAGFAVAGILCTSLLTWLAGTSVVVATLAVAIGFGCLLWLCLCYVRFFSVRLFLSHQGAMPPAREAREIRQSSALLLLVALIGLLAGPLVFVIRFLIGMLLESNRLMEQSPELLDAIQAALRADPTRSMASLNQQFPELTAQLRTFLELYSTPAWQVAAISLLAGGLLCGVLWGCTHFLAKVGRVGRCPQCGHVAHDDVLRNPRCTACGSDRSAWAYVDLASTQAQWRAERRNELLERAYGQRGRSRYRAALVTCEKLLQEEPADAEAWNLAGILHARLGHPDEARSAFTHALALRPGYHEAQLNLDVLNAPPEQPEQQATKAEAGGQLGGAGLVSGIVGLLVWRFLAQIPIIGMLLRLAGVVLIGVAIIAGATWLLRRRLPEQAQPMALPIACQSLLILVGLVIAPVVGSDPLHFTVALSLIAIGWLIVAPGMTACLLTVIWNSLFALPLVLLNIFLGDGFLATTGAILGAVTHVVIIWTTINGYKQLYNLQHQRSLLKLRA